jgi:uncharacterized membrane protein
MWPHYYYYYGWSWLWMVGMMIVLWGAIISLAAWVIRSMGRSNDNDAMAILRKRLAAGEINQDEFEKNKRLLQG